MNEFDLIIRGGTVATASDRSRCDAGVRDGKVVALADRLIGGAKAIDTTGKLVLPGGIDAQGKKLHRVQAPFRKVANGILELETRAPLLFSEGVSAGCLELGKFAALNSTNMARLYGLSLEGHYRCRTPTSRSGSRRRSSPSATRICITMSTTSRSRA